MNTATRGVLAIVGFVLVVAAAVAIFQQVGGSEPIEWQMPCVLSVLGMTALASGFLLVPDETPSTCADHDEPDTSPDNEARAHDEIGSST